MKKVVIVLVILAAVIVAGLTEIVITNNIYSKLYSRLIEVEVSMEENPKHYDNPTTIAKMEGVIGYWEKNRYYIFTVNNHINMRSLDEKLIALKAQIEVNADQDAMVNLKATKNYIQDLKQDNLPIIKNLL